MTTKNHEPFSRRWFIVTVVTAIISAIIFAILSPTGISTIFSTLWTGLENVYTQSVQIPLCGLILLVLIALWSLIRSASGLFSYEPQQIHTEVYKGIKLYFTIDPNTELPRIVDLLCPQCDGPITQRISPYGSPFEHEIRCSNGHRIGVQKGDFGFGRDEEFIEYFIYTEVIKPFEREYKTKRLQKRLAQQAERQR